jgi:hypothetical protein
MVRQDEAMVAAGTTLLPAGAEAAPSCGKTGLESAGTAIIKIAANTFTQTSLGLHFADDRRGNSNQRLPSKIHCSGYYELQQTLVGHGIA